MLNKNEQFDILGNTHFAFFAELHKKTYAMEDVN